jgi:hypothetical protein
MLQISYNLGRQNGEGKVLVNRRRRFTGRLVRFYDLKTKKKKTGLI